MNYFCQEGHNITLWTVQGTVGIDYLKEVCIFWVKNYGLLTEIY